jgi:hypothetical protein
MSLEQELVAGRAAAEALMVGEQGELRGPDTRGPMNPDGTYPVVPGVLKYAGIGKVQAADTIGNEAEAGERMVMVTRFEVHLPVSAPQSAVGDVWTPTASAGDPQLVGRRFRVTSLMHKSHPTARRLAVEETQS